MRAFAGAISPAKSLRNASSLNCAKPPDLTRPALAGGVGNVAASAAVLVPIGGRLFGVGMALVAPALGVLFLANLALVLASRVVPQLNLMAVGFPILVALGLIMMSINLDLFGALMGGEIRNLESLLVTLLRSLGHGR